MIYTEVFEPRSFRLPAKRLTTRPHRLTSSWGSCVNHSTLSVIVGAKSQDNYHKFRGEKGEPKQRWNLPALCSTAQPLNRSAKPANDLCCVLKSHEDDGSLTSAQLWHLRDRVTWTVELCCFVSKRSSFTGATDKHDLNTAGRLDSKYSVIVFLLISF